MLEILLVDDEPSILRALDDALCAEGYHVVTAFDGLSAQTALASRVFDVIVCDVRLPKVDGIALFRKARREFPGTECILMTAYATVSDAVAALKEGAVDYLAKPFDSEELVGRSPPIARLLERIAKFAANDAPVLITGESGTGKELVARALHAQSARHAKPFVAVNCAAFPETLLEAELFGHERGAFTGAVKKREGRFKAAQGGTLLLDEVADIPLLAQSKLLRVLEENTYEPLGTNQTATADVRILSATHRNLKEMVAKHLFREDLYYRLKILEIQVPALRERGGDLLLLLEHLLRKFTQPSSPPWVTARALAQYPFPGNVRELSHAIQHAVIVSEGRQVDLEHLPSEIAGTEAAKHGPGSTQL